MFWGKNVILPPASNLPLDNPFHTDLALVFAYPEREYVIVCCIVIFHRTKLSPSLAIFVLHKIFGGINFANVFDNH